jgi:hypothetical protein
MNGLVPTSGETERRTQLHGADDLPIQEGAIATGGSLAIGHLTVGPFLVGSACWPAAGDLAVLFWVSGQSSPYLGRVDSRRRNG